MIRVAPDPDFPPIEWFDAHGEFIGIAADYLSLVEKKLGIRFQIVRCKTWDEVLTKARNHEIDFLSAAAQTPGRAEYFLFSSPHIVLPGVIITRKDTRGELNPVKIRGLKVGIVSGYVWQEFIAGDYPDIKLDLVPDVQTGLKNVSFGQTDVFIENLATATYTIEKEGIANLRVAGETGYFTRLSFATRNDWPELNSILEKGLQAISPEEKSVIYRKWIRLEQGSIFRQRAFWQFSGIVAGVVFLAILIFFAWNHSLRRQVTLRTAQLKRELAERGKVELALRESEEKFILMVENANSIILRMDTAGAVTYFNKFAEDFFGFSRGEILGRNVVGTIVPAVDSIGTDLAAIIREIGMHPEKYTANENENMRKNGSRVWVSWSNKPIFDKAGVLIDILCVGNDITPLKQAQEALTLHHLHTEELVEQRTGELKKTVTQLEAEITERKAAENALEESERRYRFLFEESPAGALVQGPDGTIIDISRSLAEALGYTREELIGKNVAPFVVPDQRTEQAARLRRRFANEHHEQAEVDAVARDGSIRTILFSGEQAILADASGRKNAVLVAGMDISERKVMERDLRNSQERYRFLFEESPAGSIIIAPDGSILDVNASFLRILDYEKNEVAGHRAFDFVIPELRAHTAASVQRRFAGEYVPDEDVLVKAKDGSIHALVFARGQAIVRDNNRVTGLLLCGIDVTEQRRAEEIARRQREELIRTDKLASLGILVSGVAHEINNPNNFIILNSDNLRDIWKDVLPVLDKYNAGAPSFTVAGLGYAEVRDEVGELIGGIADGAKRIRTIVQSLKDFARQGPADMRPVNINAVIEQSIVILSNLIKKSTDRFSVECDPGIPQIRGDFQRIEQVMMNLITNACQALTGRNQAIAVRTYFDKAHDRVYIQVRDEGTGIPEENLKHIMDPFFTTKRDSGGTGLGLAISYGIVNDHCGQLFIESEAGAGTTVRVAFPRVMGPEQGV